MNSDEYELWRRAARDFSADMFPHGNKAAYPSFLAGAEWGYDRAMESIKKDKQEEVFKNSYPTIPEDNL